ncbi:ribonuclease H family protein [uncultured Dialister sp.]|jgi:ribonuclease HI|uniref:ribonuclease H family protein n=1 Tax=uncultured Dialister sp. TaxID=278064 RepID=UPI0025FF673C|nr:ribonuclease H family protein [uncultured Dialister sp.]
MIRKNFKTSAKKKYYIVKKGKKPGVYYNWPDCQKQVQGFPGAVYKGFVTREEAEAWYGKPVKEAAACGAPIAAVKKEIPDIRKLEVLYPPHIHPLDDSVLSYNGVSMTISLPEKLTIYTDGSCLVNPDGPGGFAAVFLSTDGKELLTLTGGEPSSTNNRMELRAAYEALKMADDGRVHTISFHTDSKYLQQAFTKGWVDKWKKNGWKTVQGTSVLNRDLWTAIDGLMERHHILFQWVKGHVGTKYNELCDRLAKEEAKDHR